MKLSVKIPLIYIMIGCIWVALSSYYLGAIQERIGLENTTMLEVIKALLFVVASGGLMYFLVDRALLQERRLWSSYFTVFNNSPICMWMVQKKDGGIYASNQIAERNFGPKSKERKAVKFDEILPLKGAEKKRLFGQENSQINHCKLRDISGREWVLDLYGVPFSLGDKELVMVTAVDHTELHQSLKEKTELNASLKEQNKQLKEFSFMNSHHLRRPLSNILGIISLFDEQEKNKAEAIKMLKESSEQLDQEIRKMSEVLSKSNMQLEMQEELVSQKLQSILVVDDDRVQQMINKRLFKKNNPELKLHFFENPLDALDWIETNTVDIILLDINMPEISGWEFLDKMVEKGITIEVKMLSSSIDPEDEERSKQYDIVSGFLVKPLQKEVLAEILKG